MRQGPLTMASRAYVAQGEQAIGQRPDQVFSTILGSCVAVCLWDPGIRAGGMNHILLPEGPTSEIGLRSIGAGAMEGLVNGLLKLGAEKGRLRAKVFGGAAIVAGLSDIGARNAEFALGYLAAESIPCDGKSVGGRLARQVRFWPATGRAQQRFVQAADVPETGPAQSGNDLELL